MIKKIHQIWIQGSKHYEETHKDYFEMSKLWSTIYPDFEYKLWSEKDFLPLLEQYSGNLVKSYNEAPNFACKADIARYAILHYEGGLYVDTDFEPFDRRFDFLFIETELVLVAAHLNKIKLIFNGCRYNQAFIYTAKIQHMFFDSLLKKIEQNPFSQSSQTKINYTLDITGPRGFSKMISILDLQNDLKIRILPHCMIEIADCSNMKVTKMTKEEILKEFPFAIGIHRLAATWIPSMKTAYTPLVLYSWITDWSDLWLIGLISICLILFITVVILICKKKKEKN